VLNLKVDLLKFTRMLEYLIVTIDKDLVNRKLYANEGLEMEIIVNKEKM